MNMGWEWGWGWDWTTGELGVEGKSYGGFSFFWGMVAANCYTIAMERRWLMSMAILMM